MIISLSGMFRLNMATDECELTLGRLQPLRYAVTSATPAPPASGAALTTTQVDKYTRAELYITLNSQAVNKFA